MGCLFRLSLIVIFAALIGVPAAALLMGIDQDPLVQRAGQLNTHDFRRAQNLAERYDPRRMTPGRITKIRATTAQINTVLKGVTGPVKQVAARVEMSRFGVLFGATLELPLPNNPLGRYVNIRTLVAPSRTGLRLTRLAIGAIEVPAFLIRPAMEFAIDGALGSGKGRLILGSVKSVATRGSVVTIRFQPPAELIDDIRTAARKRFSLSSPAEVKPYYRLLERTHRRLPARVRVSLAEFIRPLFELARQRSEDRDPKAENRAAMLALAIYFGDSRFERFIGDVRTAQQKSAPRRLKNIRLEGRYDFVQHFVISMGLTLAGGSEMANLIGELKEMRDSRNTSGFSFTDIGADRIGVKFAQSATENDRKARRFQKTLSASANEVKFFPRVADLPESMSRAAFRRRYGDVGSIAYRKVIDEIDRRINSTRLYR